jgi:hypothetical protein
VFPDVPFGNARRPQDLIHRSRAVDVSKELHPRLEVRLKSEFEIIVPQDVSRM